MGCRTRLWSTTGSAQKTDVICYADSKNAVDGVSLPAMAHSSADAS